MEKNGVIALRLEELVEILEARKWVHIFISGKSVKYCKVYELLTDLEFMDTCGKYKVVGISYGGVISAIKVLLEEG